MGETRTRYHVTPSTSTTTRAAARRAALAFAEHDVSIQTVRQEAATWTRQLVGPPHEATGCPAQRHRGAPAWHGDRARGHLGDARRRRVRVTTATPARTHQWRGVIEEYRHLLEILEGTAAVTPREAAPAPVHSERLSGRPAARCG